MTIHRMSAREFGENVERAKAVANEGPVFIDGDEQATHVLLAIEDYRKLNGQQSLWDSIAHWDGGDFEFDPPKANLGLRPAEFD